MAESHPEIIPQDIFAAVQAEKTRRTNIEVTDGRINGRVRSTAQSEMLNSFDIG